VEDLKIGINDLDITVINNIGDEIGIQFEAPDLLASAASAKPILCHGTP
jgi:hypothetical protein